MNAATVGRFYHNQSSAFEINGRYGKILKWTKSYSSKGYATWLKLKSIFSDYSTIISVCERLGFLIFSSIISSDVFNVWPMLEL